MAKGEEQLSLNKKTMTKTINFISAVTIGSRYSNISLTIMIY